jgi:L-ascorbate metabolism protein UlaG (beta-lactamase superfamily)
VAQTGNKLTYVGHATVLLQLAGVRLLSDPLLGSGILHVRRRVPVLPIDQFGSLDAVLISHAHRDHLDRRSVLSVARDCPVIVPRGLADSIRRWGVANVIEVDVGDRLPIGDVVIEAVRAAHDGRRHPFSRCSASLGYVLEGQSQIYFAGDTDLFAGMAALAGQIDVALLPIWGWGPRLPPGHLDPARAAEAVALIRPRIAVPIHWGTLRAVGVQRDLDPLAPARAFAAAVMHTAPATEVRILEPGQTTTL